MNKINNLVQQKTFKSQSRIKKLISRNLVLPLFIILSFFCFSLDSFASGTSVGFSPPLDFWLQVELENSTEASKDNEAPSLEPLEFHSQEYNLNLGEDNLIKFEDFSLTFSKESLLNNATIELKNLNKVLAKPWNYEFLSNIYQFDLAKDSALYNKDQQIELRIKYDEYNENYKQIFFFDRSSQIWRPLESEDDPLKQEIRAKINFPFSQVAVLVNNQLKTVGKASWYRFKNGDFTASPDFAAGTILRVSNLANNKSVIVSVNDYGPDRSVHPERVVDLDAVAFSKLADTREGIIDVKIEPIKFVNKADQDKLLAGREVPEINASSAIVVSELGDVLYNKNAEAVSPLASLSKLVAVKVFLDLDLDLEKEVKYLAKDEEYNLAACDCAAWELAKINLKDGDSLKLIDLLHASLIASANNAVESLVRSSGLSRNEFINKMNEELRSWGALNTKLVEPTGLSVNNVSSPADYAIIAKEVFAQKLISEISSKAQYSFSTLGTNTKYTIRNTNSNLFNTKDFAISGSKTGYLIEAGHCLVTKVDSPKASFFVISFNSSSKAESQRDNEKLIFYSLSKLD